jgi:hypothetical protein
MAAVIGVVAISIVVDSIPQRQTPHKEKFIDKGNTE